MPWLQNEMKMAAALSNYEIWLRTQFVSVLTEGFALMVFIRPTQIFSCLIAILYFDCY